MSIRRRPSTRALETNREIILGDREPYRRSIPLDSTVRIAIGDLDENFHARFGVDLFDSQNLGFDVEIPQTFVFF